MVLSVSYFIFVKHKKNLLPDLVWEPITQRLFFLLHVFFLCVRVYLCVFLSCVPVIWTNSGIKYRDIVIAYNMSVCCYKSLYT